MSSVSFRIISIPFEFHHENVVAWYIQDILKYGTVESVDFAQNVAPNGARFRSVTVQLTPNQEMIQPLIDAGKSGIIVPSYYLREGQDEPVQFHFDNGKPMLHMKMVIVESQSRENVPLNTDSTWSSLYIPVIPADLKFGEDEGQSCDLQSEAGLSRFIESEMNIGSVARVDFTSRSIQDSDVAVRSAYIHFNHWFDNVEARRVREQIDSRGEFVCAGRETGRGFFRFANRRFIVFKMNRSPIPDANPEANVHQLAARNKELEALVADLELRVSLLETMNEQLSKNLGESQVEAACLWDSLAQGDEDKGPMTLEELL